MTISTAYAASVNGSLSPPSSGFTDKDSNPWGGAAPLSSWLNQSGGAIDASSFNDTGGDYGVCDSPVMNETNSYPLLLYNFAANWATSITSGATISAISGNISRTEGTSTNAGAALYDLCVNLWIYNGTDLTSGALDSNEAATSTEWPMSASPASNFQTASYTFAATTYANVTNSDFGVLVGVDGTQSTKSAKAYIQYVQLSVTWSGGGDTDDSGAFGSQFGSMEASAAFIANEDNVGAVEAY